MVDHNKNRQRLIDGAIKAVSELGLEGLTTRGIEKYSGLKDSYIYRYFEDKEDLLHKAFMREDEAFIRTVEHYFPMMHDDKYKFKERCYRLWNQCWQYLIVNADTCKFYVRYYYSTYFKQRVSETHTMLCENLVEMLSKYFPEEVNVSLLLHHLLEMTLNSCMKVVLGEIEDTEEYSRTTFEYCFKIIDSCISAKREEQGNSDEKERMSYLEFYSIVNSWK